VTASENIRIPWWKAEPRRLSLELELISGAFPDLVWAADGAGTLQGRLPLWPFDRPEPEGLRAFIGGEGLRVTAIFSQAYPMVPARVFPVEPEPDLEQRTQHKWHVNGDGSLCLLRAVSVWTPREGRVHDLLLKAAGWRVEYALLTAGRMGKMTETGIVTDDSLDHLLSCDPPSQAEPTA
jgi:hypothetical protein